MGMKDDLKRIYSGPLSQKAQVILSTGALIELSGYASTKSFDRGLEDRYLAKSQRVVFHALADEAADVKVGDTMLLQKKERRIVAITDNLDGTVAIELKEEILQSREEEDNGSGSDDSSRFG